MSGKEWISYGKTTKDKKKKTQKEPKIDPEKTKLDQAYENFIKDEVTPIKKIRHDEYDVSKVSTKLTTLKNKNQKNTKKKQKVNLEKQSSFDTSIENLDAKDFSEYIQAIKTKFPKSPSIWIFETISYLNSKINSTTKDVLNLINTEFDFPINLMNENFKKELEKLFKELEKDFLYKIQSSIIETEIPKIFQNHVSRPVGLLLFLQFLSIYLKKNSNENIKILKSIINKHKETPNVYLTQVWCLRIVGYFNLKEGLNIWKELYLPISENKYYCSYSLNYIQQVFKLNPTDSKTTDLIIFNDFLRFINTKTSIEFLDIIEKILYQLKPICVDNLNKQDQQNAFYVLFNNLHSNKKNNSSIFEFQKKCLVYLLEKNKTCHNVWFELHKNLNNKQDYLLEEFLDKNANLPTEKKDLNKTLKTIIHYDKSSNNKNYNIEEALQKMACSNSKCWNLLTLIFFGLLVFVLYDSVYNGSFERSQTSKFLKNYSFYSYVHQIAMKIENYVTYMKNVYDLKYKSTVDLYLGGYIKKFKKDILPKLEPYVVKASDLLKNAFHFVQKNSEIYFKKFTEFSSQYINYNEIKNQLEIVAENFVVAYSDLYKWAYERISSINQ